MSSFLPRPRIALPLAAVLTALLSGLIVTVSSTHAATPGQHVDISIAKFAYGPQDITVAPGTTVTWINHDEAPHTVTSTDKSFASKGMDTDDKYQHTFANEGDFAYICTVHPFMTGTVHVHKP